MLKSTLAKIRQSNLLITARCASFGVKVPQSNNLTGMIEWYQRNGHHFAQTDPLQLQK
jgi:2-oxoglutarate dehydrogenase complex dehydrogenase (E1) component-like enzyme